jgi:hypothetical protein
MKNQFDLCLEVLRRLQKASVLDHIVIIGSWCIYFYRNYFIDTEYSSSIGIHKYKWGLFRILVLLLFGAPILIF